MADPTPENNEERESEELETAAGAEADIGEASAAEAESPTEELSLEEMVAKLEADLADAQDSALRAQADAANVQRRAEQEIDKARKFALDRFVGELLPVVDNMERALSAATVHDFFNVMAVIVLLPFELVTGLISRLATGTADLLIGSGGAEWESPLKALVKAPVSALKDGLKSAGFDGNALGISMVAVGLVVVLISLISITKNMKQLIAARLERSMNRVLGRGGGIVAIIVGILVTVAVQSSSITTSILIPMSAAGVITLRNAYPVTLGANVGTTITALLAAMAASGSDALSIALVHTWFNVIGILVLFGIPFLRPLPIRAAELLAEVAVRRRTFAFVWVLGMFIIVPLIGVAIFR